MNWLDILILIPVVFFAWQGLKNGLIMEVFTLAALILGIWASLEFSYVAEDFLHDTFNWNSEHLNIIAFIVTFIVVVVVVNLLGKLLKSVFQAVALGAIDKILGLAFGAAKAIVLLAIVVYVFNSFDMKKGLISDDVKDESFCYPYLNDIVNEVEDIIDDEDFEMPDFKKEREKLEEKVEETFNT